MSDATLWRARHLLIGHIDDETLILNPIAGRFHTLSHSAGLVFAAADGTLTVTGLATVLSFRLRLKVDQILDDVTNAVEIMVAEELLVMGQPTLEPSDQSTGLMGPIPTPIPVELPRLNRVSTDGALVQAGSAIVRIDSAAPVVSALLAEPLGLLPSANCSETADVVVSVVDPGDGGPFEIRNGTQNVVSAFSPDEAAQAVLSACNQVAATHSIGAVRIHGGVVARGELAVVICGPSGSGKSSLTAALVKDGWRYLTDEVAVIDPATRGITAYPKCIDLSEDSMQLLGLNDSLGIGPVGPKRHVSPTELGEVGEAATVEAFVLLIDSEGPSPELQEIALRDSVDALLGNVFASTWDHQDALQALVGFCEETIVVKMRRQSIDKMVSLVETLIK